MFLTCFPAPQNCTLSAQTVISAGEKVPDFTVVFSNGSRRIDGRGYAEIRKKVQARHVDVLKRLIPSNPAKFQ